MNNWSLVVVAALFEVGWALGLKSTAGFSRFWPSLGTAAALVISVVLLGLAARTLPIGAAYAVWTGLGAAGTIAAGAMFFGEPVSAARLVCVGLILGGVAGLKFAP